MFFLTIYCFLLQRNISDMAENMRQFFGEFVNKKKDKICKEDCEPNFHKNIFGSSNYYKINLPIRTTYT